MHHSYKTKGTCSKNIEFDIDGDVVRNIQFEGGCNGNLKGVAKLAEGRTVEEIVSLLGGVRCDKKKTSCPDQLAKALKKHSQKQD